MSGENANVRVELTEEDDNAFVVRVTLNGLTVGQTFTVPTAELANQFALRLARTAEEAHRIGYRAGYTACQNVIKDALGVRK